MRAVSAILLLLVILGATPIRAAEMDESHVREELGVNTYTAPSVQDLLDALGLLGPIPFSSVKRDIPPQKFSLRAQLALNFGSLVADAFLIVGAERTGNAEAVARGLLRDAKGLAISQTVTRHAQSLSERVAKEQWTELRTELVSMQGDVEKALLALKDEEIAHMISLGGWIRALEICARTANAEYTPKRAAQLIQPDLTDYFLDRVQTLEPKLQALPLFQVLQRDLQRIQAITAEAQDGTLSKAQVKAILGLAHEMNEQIATPCHES